MGFFNDLGKKTTETTSKIAKETKLKMKISENKGKIKELYEDIGTKVYEKYIREENINIKEDLAEQCSKIKELSVEVEEARKEILKLNNKKLCEKCFAQIDKDMQFCPKCGEKQNEEKTVFENAEEKLENAEISLENVKEAEIVKEELEQKNNEQ
ncbi:MAG: zinc ribbon domain-containing protein [Clostridia bacterium]|nr:zinc ribbon domain-containing protein [Clostridia bacterium]